MIRVFCENSTPRVRYIFQFLLDTVCGFRYEITSNAADYCSYNGPTLNYSSKSLKQNDLQIRPNGLLFLQTISPCTGFIEDGRDGTLYLKGPGLDETTFDVFAASFYLLARYEEYLDYKPDGYGRFEAAASLLFRHGLLHRPLINEWAEALRHQILNRHPGMPFRSNTFRYKISIDVDQAFAFSHRGAVRNALSFFKNVANGNALFLRSQVQTLLSKKDPYDTFGYLKTVQQEYALPAIYFVNVGAYSKYDKNVPTTNKQFQKLLNAISGYAEIGLHPSYFSNARPHKFREEKTALEHALQQPVTQSRQHYLKLQLPQTYRNLIAIGIREDYSMGYASHPGFRAGTCTPFYWFDLEQDTATDLKIYPVVYMENAYAEDLGMPPEKALRHMITLTDTVRFYNGCHISIWHNHSVNDALLWKGWRSVFEQSLQHLLKLS